MPCGILAPDTIISQRRQQNLGLASAVRHFNDREMILDLLRLCLLILRQGGRFGGKLLH